jgi:hypothetical protein
MIPLCLGSVVPEISRFFGIVIRMFFDDHPPPHLHAQYGERSALVALQPIAVIESDLPARAASMVLEWTALHQQELLENWERLHTSRPPVKVAPLI